VGVGSKFHFGTVVRAGAGDLPAWQRGSTALRGKRLLFVEDNVTQQRALAALGQIWGLEVIAAEGVEAAELRLRAAENPCQVLLLDHELLGESTAAVIRRLRAQPGAVGAAVLLLSAQRARASFAQSLGAEGSIAKPLRPAPILESLVRALTGTTQREKRAPTVSPFVSSGKTLADRLPLRLLVADDNAVNQKVALMLLRRLGYAADAVANGIEALQSLEANPYDLVLLDVQMPEMDGFEATRQIRARVPVERQPKIIALTANAMQGDRELCVAAGMDDYISKPVKMHEISSAIRRHFAKTEVVETTEQSSS